MNPWKLATIGLLIVFGTALTTGLTTAWLMRPSSTATTAEAGATPARLVSDATATATRARIVPAVARGSQRAVALTRPAAEPVAAPIRRVSSEPAAACDSTGDRVWRIAKPGLLGGLLGAGLGAAGGAVADGGTAAGKGAVIGGIAGAALGSAYGAYKTKNECGTILGNGATANVTVPANRSLALGAATPAGSADGITIYNAR
jgi:hypothetical protein